MKRFDNSTVKDTKTASLEAVFLVLYRIFFENSKKTNTFELISRDQFTAQSLLDASFYTECFLILWIFTLDSDKGFKQLPVSKNTKLKVTMQPYSGFVGKI